MGQLPICTDTGLNYFHCTKSFVGTYEELVKLITQRFNARAIMFKIRPESPEFKTLDEVKAKTYLALSYTMLTKGTNKKTAVLFNESQWMVYNSNPGKRTLAYIFQLNPDAGELIAENLRSKERSEIMSTGTI